MNIKYEFDILLRDAKAFTCDDYNTWAEAIGIKGQAIVFVGTNEEADKYIGADTVVYDLCGKMVLPGFIDSHSHPAYLTQNVYSVDLKGCSSVSDYLQKLKKYADGNPDREIVYGINFDHSLFGPTGPSKSLIDAVIPDRPIVVYSGDGHALWVNSEALRLAGIDKDTSEPDGGGFVKDEKGELTGFINTFSALSFFIEQLPDFTAEEYAMGIKEYIDNGLKSGITFCHDSDVFKQKFYDAYTILEQNGLLKMRFRLAPSIYPSKEESIEEQFETVLRYHNDSRGDLLQSNTLKIMFDSVFYSRTAAVEEPYEGFPNDYGDIQWNIDDMKWVFKRAAEEGIQLEFHCIGDRASRIIVEALEESLAETGLSNERPMLNHLQLINDDLPERMHKLGAIALPNPQWVERDGFYLKMIETLGEKRAKRMHPVKTFIDHDVCVATGSDVPVEHRDKHVEVYYAPLIAIQQAVTRCAIDADYHDENNLVNPSEAVSLEDMIKIFTINGAYANFAENITGSLEPGKYADLIVLEKNLFDLDPGDIYKTKILMTMLEGNVVYQSDEM